MGVQINGSEGNVIATKGTYSGNVTIGGTLTYEDVTNIDSVGLVTARTGIEIGARPGVAASISVDGNMIVSGISTFNGDVKLDGGNLVLGDSGGSNDDRIKLGAGGDLSIYHDGSNSYVDNATGTLLLQSTATATVKGTTVQFENAAGTEVLLKAIQDGAVELYHNNSKKFETQSAGVEITGKLTFATEGLAGGSIDLGIDADLNLYHDNSDAYFDNNTGDFYIRNDGNSTSEKVRIQAKGGEQSIICSPNGAVELYYDDGIRLTTTSTGINVTQAGSGSVSTFSHGGGAGGVRIAGPAASSAANLIFANNFNNSVSDEWAIQLDGSNDDLVFVEGGTGGNEIFRIKSDRDFVETLSGNDTTKFDQTSSANNIFKTFMYHRSASSRGDVSFIKIGENSSSAGEIRLKTSAGNAALSGGVYISGGGTSFGSLSDTRLKNKISDIADALTNLDKIDTWKYSWTYDSANTPHLGVTAQSVNSVFPEVVNTTKGLQDESDETEYYGVLYTELIPVCIAAIKELKTKVETLESEVAVLKSS